MSTNVLNKKALKYRKVIYQLLNKGFFVVPEDMFSSIDEILDDLVELGFICYFDTDRRIFLGKEIYYLAKVKNEKPFYYYGVPLAVGTIDMLNDKFGFNYDSIEDLVADDMFDFREEQSHLELLNAEDFEKLLEIHNDIVGVML